jgi:hypothetical protein
MNNTISEYRNLTREIGKTMSRLASEPVIKREVEYYRKNISNIKSIDDFMGNQRIYEFALTAFGMKDLTYAKAMIRKVLTEGIDNNRAFAFSLADPRFRDFAQTFNFKSYGSSTTAFDRTQQGTIDRFLRNSLEEKAGQSNEALRLALYFERKASGISTEYGVLADKAIYAVVRTALGLPDAMASSDIDKQAKLLGDRIKVADFSDPQKRGAFITRFLAMSDRATGASAGNNPAMALFSGSLPGLDSGVLMSLQSIRRFGS